VDTAKQNEEAQIMSEELRQDSELSTENDEGGSHIERLGRRALMLGAATGAGAVAGLIAGADPAGAANGGDVLLGKTNKATATTTVSTTKGNAVEGKTSADSGRGLYGSDTSSGGGYGVYAASINGTGVYGQSGAEGGTGVLGYAPIEDAVGVYGLAAGVDGTGVSGRAVYIGVEGVCTGSDGFGVFASASGPSEGLSVDGNASVSGSLSKGSGSFKIDHPLDPAGKYLYHSFVESPDMMNIYNGTVALDRDGQARVELPDWFGALNRDYRYQLTPIGAPAQNLHISSKVVDGAFSIAGGNKGQEVSWQVTGIRQDAFANAHRIVVEVHKPAEDQGRYLHPELFGKGDEQVVTAVAKARSHGRRRASTVA
jgi:hypothetical protein